MPLSPADRIAAQKQALKWLLKGLGDRSFHSMSPVELDDEIRYAIPPTTWKDLEARGRITVCWFFDEILSVHFTASGWFDAMTLTGKLDEATFKESFGVLSAALKKRTSGHREDDQVEVWRLMEETGLQEEFIANCINADIRGRGHGKYGAEFLPNSQDYVYIPSRFNMPIVS